MSNNENNNQKNNIVPIDPTRYVSDGTTIIVKFGAGINPKFLSKHLSIEYKNQEMTLKVIDNRIYINPIQSNIYAKRIDTNEVIECIYPRDSIKIVR